MLSFFATKDFVQLILRSNVIWIADTIRLAMSIISNWWSGILRLQSRFKLCLCLLGNRASLPMIVSCLNDQ